MRVKCTLVASVWLALITSPLAAKSFRGRLIDSQGEQITDTELTVEIYLALPGSSGTKQSAITTATDDQGQFSIELPEKSADNKRFYLKVFSDDCLVPQIGVGKADRLLNVACIRVQRRASKIHDYQGKPVAGASVTLHLPSELDYFRRTVKTDAQGRYELSVPPELDFGIVVDSPAGAVHRMVMPAGAEMLPEIKLQQGTTLKGQLLDLQGDPVKNCVVIIEGDDSQALDAALTINNSGYAGLQLNKSVMTDADGRFAFPPLHGQCVVYLGVPSQHFRSSTFPKAIKPPPMAPVSVLLSQPGDQALTLKAETTAPIQGTITSVDGEPVSGVRVQYMQPPIHGLRYFTIASSMTNRQGKYHLHVPVSAKQVDLMINTRFIDNVAHHAWPTKPSSTAANWRGRRFRIRDFDGQPKTVDWVLVKQRVTPDFVLKAREDAKTFSEPDVHPAIRLLESQVANRKSDSDDDPRIALMDLCLKLESKNRGNRVGLSMLHYIMRAGETSMDMVPSMAREKAIDVLKEHYAQHADLDLLITGFAYGNLPSNAEPLLRAAMEQTQHQHVRAQATYSLAEFKQTLVTRLPMLKGHREASERLLPIQTEETQRYMRKDIENVKRLEAKFADVNLEDEAKQSQQLYQQVVEDHAGVKTPTRYWEGPARVRLTDISDPSRQWNTTLAERAEAKLFHKQLVVDQAAPQLEGLDLYLRKSSLADFHGRVVLLTVTSFTVRDREMYAGCQALINKYADQPFTVVSVVPSDADGGYSVRDIVRECQITWPIIRDTEGGDNARKWCQNNAPEVYVIDQKGIIRCHSTSENVEVSDAGRKVAELLSE